eukprot:29829-Pleurochrysis_carterae.AAC.2
MPLPSASVDCIWSTPLPVAIACWHHRRSAVRTQRRVARAASSGVAADCRARADHTPMHDVSCRARRSVSAHRRLTRACR